MSITSRSFTISGWFKLLLLLTSQKNSLILEKPSLALLMALMASTRLVVHAEQASGLKFWLWPQVAEKVSPAEVLHYYKQSLLVSNTSSSFTIFGWFNILMLLTSENTFEGLRSSFFPLVFGLDRYHSHGGLGPTGLGPQSLALLTSG